MKSINPATGELVREYAEHRAEEVERRLGGSETAFARWRSLSFSDRAQRLRAIATLLRRRRDALARTMTEEMGKPITQSEAEVEKCAWVCEHYAETAEADLQRVEVDTDASQSFVSFEPLGPILAIMPWNFPLWQVFRFAAPSMMVGNVTLLKHAPGVTGCALAIEELAVDAGCDAGVMAALLLSNERTEAVIAHDAIRAVTLTGSVRAGKRVAAIAGANVKKTVLELGGSDPFVVLDDADLDATSRSAVSARTMNTGQSCIAAKRFLVAERVADAFTEALVERMNALVVGDPTRRDTDVGPLAREDLRTTLQAQVDTSVELGARCVLGGNGIDGHGYFYEPTVLTRVAPGMPAFDEETFGPVAAVTTFRGVDDAVELANRTLYGLGASIWTRDATLGAELASRIESGNVFVNGIVRSDPRLPFGGIRQSGYGRELGTFGLREFVNTKTTWIAPATT